MAGNILNIFLYSIFQSLFWHFKILHCFKCILFSNLVPLEILSSFLIKLDGIDWIGYKTFSKPAKLLLKNI